MVHKPRECQFADYNAAAIVLSNLELIYDDLVDNGGIKYKIMINDMLRESTGGSALARTSSSDSALSTGGSGGGGSALAVRRGELDEVELLMRKVENAPNRKEKRRLLAEYNQRQELIWGQAKSIAAMQPEQQRTLALIKKNAEASLDVQKVYNQATQSYIDKDLMD